MKRARGVAETWIISAGIMRANSMRTDLREKVKETDDPV